MSKELIDKDVAAYLLANPDFFVDRDRLLLKIQVPHKSKGTISLVEKQLDVIRDRQKKTRRQLKEFVENAERNKEIFDKSRKIILSMMAAKQSSKFFAALEKGLKRDFGCKANSLVVFGKPKQINHFTSRIPAESARKYVGALMQSKVPTLGTLRPREQDFLFRDQSEKVKSAAVLTIRDKNKHLGLLAIGSSDMEYFTPDMDALFINFIAETLGKLLPQHLPR
ncbi:MAG: DUF484 family protein [Pseudomonadales bacterium]|jgi:uncharacterized protein YigA (DUF484 family)|nr:DUF484 family protein [Pseudomonadales bacterium]